MNPPLQLIVTLDGSTVGEIRLADDSVPVQVMVVDLNLGDGSILVEQFTGVEYVPPEVFGRLWGLCNTHIEADRLGDDRIYHQVTHAIRRELDEDYAAATPEEWEEGEPDKENPDACPTCGEETDLYDGHDGKFYIVCPRCGPTDALKQKCARLGPDYIVGPPPHWESTHE